MDYNINFQVAALIIVALLLHYFLTQKKLHNANAKIFTYVLILAGLYILLDRIKYADHYKLYTGESKWHHAGSYRNLPV